MKHIRCIVLAWLTLLTTAQAADFDCSKAGSKIEKLICENSELSSQDDALNITYQQALALSKDKNKIIKAQKHWLKEVRNTCQTVECLKKVYQAQIDGYETQIQESTAPPKTIPGTTDAAKFSFLQTLDTNPFRRQYYELALTYKDVRIRKLGAGLLYGDLDKITPILLKIMTGDSDQEIRLEAALNLHCQYTCNGADYEPKNARVLESDLALLKKGIRDEVAGRYVVEILDAVWCDLTKKSRRDITVILKSDLPYGKDTVGINQAAEYLLRHRSIETCP